MFKVSEVSSAYTDRQSMGISIENVVYVPDALPEKQCGAWPPQRFPCDQQSSSKIRVLFCAVGALAYRNLRLLSRTLSLLACILGLVTIICEVDFDAE